MPLLYLIFFECMQSLTSESVEPTNLFLMYAITSLIACHVILECKYLIKLVVLPSLKLLIYTTFLFSGKKLYYL